MLNLRPPRHTPTLREADSATTPYLSAWGLLPKLLQEKDSYFQNYVL